MTYQEFWNKRLFDDIQDAEDEIYTEDLETKQNDRILRGEYD